MKGQQGTIAVETAVVAPVLLVLMMLVVYAGRASQADADVRAAAARAARAASVAADATSAVDAAETAAKLNLAVDGVACRTHRVDVDTSAFGAGGHVTVGLACEVANADIVLLSVPGSRWSVASATQVVDTFRGGG